MFFSISSEHQYNFSYFYKLGDFCISTDAGWNQYEFGNYTVVYKGYVDCADLADLLESIVQQNEPVFTGDFCAIVFDQHSKSIQVKTDKYRGFPIYVESARQVTNLIALGRTVWADGLISMDSKFNITETKFNVIGPIDTDTISVDHLIDQVDTILTQRTQQFLSHNKLPLRAFLTGGVDSLLVYSYLKKFTDQFDLIKYQHFDYDRFWMLNSDSITEQYLEFRQLHHWHESIP